MATMSVSSIKRARALHPATIATLLCGVALSCLLFAILQASEHARNDFDVDRRVQARVAAVARSFDDAAEAMRAINLLLGSTAKVDEAQFARFAAPLAGAHPYIQALAFYRFVRADERDAYEAARRAHWPDFRIRERRGAGFEPAAVRPLYLPLDKIIPEPVEHIAHGYDIWAFGPHRTLVERTLARKDWTASGLVPLIEPKGGHGIVIAMPLAGDGRGAGPDGAEGVTEVVIDVASLIEQKLLSANLLRHRGVEVALAGQVDGKATMLEVARYGHAVPDEPAWWGKLLGAHLVERSQRFDVYGQSWELRARAREAAAVHLGSSVLLVLSLVCTLAVTAYVHASVTRRRRVERLVELSTADLRRTSETMRLYFRAIDASANGVILVDATRPGYPIEYVNPAFMRMRGYGRDELNGRRLDELIAGLPEQAAVHELQNTMREEREGHALLRLRRKDGSELYAEVYVAPVHGADGRTEHFVITEYDVTTAKRYEAELEHRARYDALTGLPNRALLGDRIERAVVFAGQHGRQGWVVALDLDHFKYVNDSLGHPAGDRVLQQAARRITAAVRPADTVARTGGDEFVLMLIERNGEDQVMATVDAVLRAVGQPFEDEGRRFHLSCSAGIAAFPTDGRDAETLVKHAEIAMYRAKEAGRDTARFYLPGMNERVGERLALVDAMRVALAGNQFELHYQPQILLATGRVIGMEALIRWRHPELGMMRPDRFIALAEDTGLIVPIGAWALRSACAQAAAWQRAGHGALRVAVNLSSRQFRETGLATLIADTLRATGLDAACLELELTESLVMDEVERAIATMGEIKAMGVQLAIDDFGTGYSSLAYLKRFPVDVLKIDQSFVRDIETDAGSAAMVGAIVSLAHDLGMRVIAEGVETAPQRDFLHARGCDEVQGYLISRPLPAAEFERMLEGRRAPLPARQG